MTRARRLPRRKPWRALTLVHLTTRRTRKGTFRMTHNPPTPKYKLTLTITGNSHDEIESELLSMTRGGYLLDSDYGKRDEFHVTGGRRISVLEHTNPAQTPEQYDAELERWWQNRKADQ